MKDILKDFLWHSSFDLDDFLHDKKKVVKISSRKVIASDFLTAKKDCNYLIHKSSKALWRWSKDRKYIEPVFEEDILTSGDFK